AELAAIVGSVVPRHTEPDTALGHIIGYSCFNDASVRQYQRLTSQWTIGKNFDATGAFGPVLVTADELPEGAAGLSICSRLNGDVMQQANTNDMLFPVAETVALLSQCLTLRPGDLLVMGTPAGVGHARTPPVWMKPGDICEIDIEEIGILTNPVVAES
ncbi:MAG: fumarylacetoacetate hydrolase family protein, partial [Pseudomonadota bacterium]